VPTLLVTRFTAKKCGALPNFGGIRDTFQGATFENSIILPKRFAFQAE
jgi:hypothetical protein